MEDSKTLSEKLQALIIPPHDLAVNLANGLYATHKPIALDVLQNEVNNGIMSKEQFRELCIQDFFKQSAKIWKDQTQSSESWELAIDQYYQSKFLAFTGVPFNKPSVFNEMVALRWRVKWVVKWFKKNGYKKPLPPSFFFDFARKSKQDGGFEYTKRKYAKYLKRRSQICQKNKLCCVLSGIHRQNMM